jgi:hypothetical protein
LNVSQRNPSVYQNHLSRTGGYEAHYQAQRKEATHDASVLYAYPVNGEY